MKFNYETKVQIYELRQMGESIKSLSKTFSMAESDLNYMIRLIGRHGVSIVQKKEEDLLPSRVETRDHRQSLD